MKKYIILSAAIAAVAAFTSCNSKEKLPAPASSADAAKTLITGKVWQVVDVATVTGSRPSVFDKEKVKNETIVAPAVENLNWFSAGKEKGNQSEFTKSFYENNLKISIALNKDSLATTTGMDATKQVFSITDANAKDEPKGIKLALTGESKSFADVGVSKFTADYYILGASDNTLYLLTPNTLNEAKVVFLLKTK